MSLLTCQIYFIFCIDSVVPVVCVNIISVTDYCFVL